LSRILIGAFAVSRTIVICKVSHPALRARDHLLPVLPVLLLRRRVARIVSSAHAAGLLFVCLWWRARVHKDRFAKKSAALYYRYPALKLGVDDESTGHTLTRPLTISQQMKHHKSALLGTKTHTDPAHAV
jgi:hypothetical protein